jgi:hypothetical protein
MIVILDENPSRWLKEFMGNIPEITERLECEFSIAVGVASIQTDGTSADELLKAAYNKLQIEKMDKHKNEP